MVRWLKTAWLPFAMVDMPWTVLDQQLTEHGVPASADAKINTAVDNEANKYI